MKESPIERKCRRIAEAHGYRLLKFIPFGFIGFPDRILLGYNAKIMFLEFKKPKGGKVKSHQERRINELRNRGFEVEVIDSVEGFCEVTGLEYVA